MNIPEKQGRLIGATVRLMLEQGFSGTTVDQICATAGVTKGSFFHYFSSKEEIGRAAMEAWTGSWVQILEEAEFEKLPDPLDRLKHLFEVMLGAYLSPEIGPGCLVGTIAQEQAGSRRDFGGWCNAHLDTWRFGVIRMLEEAKAAHPPVVDFDSESLADFMLGMVQGTLLVAKTRQDRAVIVNNVRHCRAYVLGFFGEAADHQENP